METTQVAVDLAKSVFEVAVSHEVGQVAECRRLNRSGFRRFLEKQEPSEISSFTEPDPLCGPG